jgi:hypothetical protein
LDHQYVAHAVEHRDHLRLGAGEALEVLPLRDDAEGAITGSDQRAPLKPGILGFADR